jgi:hypothetical protein
MILNWIIGIRLSTDALVEYMMRMKMKNIKMFPVLEDSLRASAEIVAWLVTSHEIAKINFDKMVDKTEEIK